MKKGGVEDVDKEMEEGIIEGFGLKSFNYNSMIDRYFTKYYFDYEKETEQYYFLHSNGY